MAVIKKIIRRTLRIANRNPWIIPLFGFVSGAASFLLVERKQEQFAQLISILMLAGWIWLVLENSLKRGISHWFGIKVPRVVLRYVSQLIHQESLFFVIPFFFITTTWNSGQVIFTSLLIIAALISLIDPIYYHWLAPRRWLYFTFHGITLFAALLTALPLIFHLPTSQSYLWALGVAAVLSAPGIARSFSEIWWKRIPIMLLFIVGTFGIGLAARHWIPPASIWLTQVAITDRIDDESRSPNKKFKIITPEQLHQGIYAYTAIHAPRGLRERVYHAWYQDGKQFDRIALDISGGNEDGYRSWSHKKNFPKDAEGNWRIQVETEARQVLGILRFKVVDSKTDSKISDAPKRTLESKPATQTKVERKESISSEPEPSQSSDTSQALDSSESNTSEPAQSEVSSQAEETTPQPN
ncbi:MAG: DUF2914 domain-containing protein [Gammaproteobacteria bacterium]|nr:MAG: DUF2914 domain-containing protein [Gammaproteobacteria bacterium]